MPFRFPRGSSYGDGTIDAFSFDTLPNDGERPADPALVRFRSIAEIMLRGMEFEPLSRFLEATNIVASRLPGLTRWSTFKVIESDEQFVAFCESTGDSKVVSRTDVICHQLNSRQLAAELNAALSLGRKPEWLDSSRRVWFLGNLSLELQSRPVYISLHIASDLITEALHVAAAHAKSTFLLLDLNSKRRDQKFDASAKIVDCKPVEIEQLISVTSDGRLLTKSKSRELIASILGVTLESRLSGYVFQRKGKHRMLAFNSEIEITAETNGTWYIEQLLAKPNLAFRCTQLESLLPTESLCDGVLVLRT